MNILLKITLLFLVFPFTSFSQVMIDYSNPGQNYPEPWEGDTTLFIKSGNEIISQGILQTPSSIFLFTPSNIGLPREWEFESSIHCSTSSGNYLELLLFTDSINNSSSRFVRIGGTMDEIALIAYNSGIETKLIDGPDGVINSSSFNKVRLKVILTDSLDWKLFFASTPNDPNWQLLGSCRDSTAGLQSYTGIHVKHSSGNRDKYRIQKFIHRTHVQDTIVPALERILKVNERRLDIYFTEPIHSFSTINSPQVDLSSATINHMSSERLSLDLPTGIILPDSFLVAIDSIIDLELNVNPSHSRFAEKAYADFGDVVFSEVFADPQPAVGPFSDEFVELYNRSDHPVQLQNYQFCDASTCMILPDLILDPGAYLILSSVDQSDSVLQFNSASFPSLNNYGDDLSLLDPFGRIVHFLSYSDDWYGDPNKQDGGYSLESIDPKLICAGIDNWKASSSPLGATPGKVNSVYEENHGLISEFKPLYVQVLNDTVLKVEFSYGLHPETGVSISINNDSLIIIDSVTRWDKSLLIYLSQTLDENRFYSLYFHSVTDCEGNFSEQQELHFCRTVNVNFQDLRITEVLFDPQEDDSDFFEIMNVSEHPIALDQLFFSSIRNGEIYQGRNFPKGLFLAPDAVLAFSLDKDQTSSKFPKGNSSHILSVLSLPILSNESGTLAVFSRDSVLVDRIDYKAEWHHPSLRDLEGVSLTLRDTDFQENNSESWRSSTFDEGWGTPGVFYSDTSSRLKTSVVPGIITPDGDGRDDYAGISLSTSMESIVSLVVYNEWGQLVRRLTEETLIGSSGQWFWDGTDEQGAICDKGIYIIFIKTTGANNSHHFFRHIVRLL